MSEENSENFTVSTRTLLSLLLGAMFVLAAFQTLQLSELKQDVLEQKTTISQLKAQQGGTPAIQAQPASSASIPQSLQSVPDMVGGC